MKVSRSRIQALRERKGWRQADLGDAAGLSSSYVSQVETGQREPSPVAVAAIARALGVDVEHLEERHVTCPECGATFNA